MRKLEILYKVAIEGISGSTDLDVNLISIDSRNIKLGNMYVAIKGAKVDGHDFIDQSIASGAKSIICEVLPKTLAEGVVYIKVDDAREALAWLAANFYDNPSSQLQLIGITGTNGKTSIAKLLFDLFKNKKLNAGLISTVAIQYSDREFKATHTTPDPLTINKHLSDMVEQGLNTVLWKFHLMGLTKKSNRAPISGRYFQISLMIIWIIIAPLRPIEIPKKYFLTGLTIVLLH